VVKIGNVGEYALQIAEVQNGVMLAVASSGRETALK